MTNDKITIATCNFNTTELTNNLIRSIFQNVKSYDFSIVVFDNSDKCQFKKDNDLPPIRIIDNTNGQFINFVSLIKTMSIIPSKNNHASLKHSMSIQFLLNSCLTKHLLLFDSDTRLLKDIDFIDERIVSAFDIHNNGSKTRALPFIQYFNVQMIKSLKLKYLDINRMHGGMNIKNNNYDTGASFYEDICSLNLPFKKINYKEYIWHMKRGSW